MLNRLPIEDFWRVRSSHTFKKWLGKMDWNGAIIFTLPLILYLLTLSPTIYNLDSAEFTTAVLSNGLLRATGYPLYLIVGKLWSYLPLSPDMGYRMNLLSAVCSATAILFGELILRRFKVNPWARFGALGLLATAPYFWVLSVIAEVYTLHVMLMAATIFTLLRWSDGPTPLRFAIPVLLMSLSVGNHMATVLLVPGCVWFVIVSHPRELSKWRVWLAGGTAVLLGATVFLILPLRYAAQPVFNYAGEFDASGIFQPVNLQTIKGILWLISGQTFSGQMFGYKLHEVGAEIGAFGTQLWTAFLAVGIGPGLLGIFILLRKNWRISTFFILLFLANAIFYINYDVVDKNTMFLPAYFVWALWVGIGYQWLSTYLTQHQPELRPYLHGAFVLVVGIAIVANWQQVDRSNDWSTRIQSETIMATVEPNAIVFGWWETVPALEYLQLVEGKRPDVTLINRFLISGENMNHLIANEIGERPIYINNPSIALLQAYHVTAVGPLYQLEPR